MQCGSGFSVFTGGFEQGSGYASGGFGGGGGTRYAGGGGGGYSGGGGGAYEGVQSPGNNHGGGGGGGSYIRRGATKEVKVKGGNMLPEGDGMIILSNPCNPGESISSNGKCVNVDACKVHPCGEGSTCIDKQPPASGGPDGRECTCARGTTLMELDLRCHDIDACVETPCKDANAVCKDHPPPQTGDANGRSCTCQPGMAMKAGVCGNANACLDFPCGSENAQCIDLPPPLDNSEKGRVCACKDPFQGNGDECSCPDGYNLKDGICQDIDACESAPCGAHTTCEDLEAPHLGNESGRVCTCVAPRSIGNGTVCQCPSGTSGTGEGDGESSECSDTDACAVLPCSSHATCKDMPADSGLTGKRARVCTCNKEAGFVGTGEPGDCNCPRGEMIVGGICQDIDACAVTPCAGEDEFVDCADKPAPADGGLSGRTCVCSDGFATVDGQCLDIDACVQNPCANHSGFIDSCIDKPAPAGASRDGRTCTCLAGYSYLSSFSGSEKCVDENWCDNANCGANSVCTDLAAPAEGYTCACKVGFELADAEGDPNGACQPMDPCRTFPCAGASVCSEAATAAATLGQALPQCVQCANMGVWPNFVNAEAGRTCWCPAGYTIGPDGACVDYDGCAGVPCDGNAACADKPAPAVDYSYVPSTAWKASKGHSSDRSCVCLAGWRGDGELCVEDKNSAGGLGGGVDADGNAIEVDPMAATGEEKNGNSMTPIVVIMGIVVVVGLVAVIAMRMQESRHSKSVDLSVRRGSQMNQHYAAPYGGQMTAPAYAPNQQQMMMQPQQGMMPPPQQLPQPNPATFANPGASGGGQGQGVASFTNPAFGNY